MRRTVPTGSHAFACSGHERATIAGMRRSLKAVLLALASLLAACDMATPAGRAPEPPAASSAMEFRGERPCTDCLGIESWLRLDQDGATRSYRLVEHYRSAGHQRRFEEAGEWAADGDLLRLRYQGGGERVYARLAEGVLQARDSQGRPLAGAADDVMMPVNFATVR